MDEGQLARGYRLRVMGETKRAIDRGWFAVDCLLKWDFEGFKKELPGLLGPGSL